MAECCARHAVALWASCLDAQPRARDPGADRRSRPASGGRRNAPGLHPGGQPARGLAGPSVAAEELGQVCILPWPGIAAGPMSAAALPFHAPRPTSRMKAQTLWKGVQSPAHRRRGFARFRRAFPRRPGAGAASGSPSWRPPAHRREALGRRPGRSCLPAGTPPRCRPGPVPLRTPGSARTSAERHDAISRWHHPRHLRAAGLHGAACRPGAQAQS